MSSSAPTEAVAREWTLPRPVAVRPRWWLDALVIAWLCWVYDLVANLAPLRLHAALAHGEGLLSAERALHLDPELALNRWLGAHHTLASVLSYYYDNAHFVVTLGLLVWLWWRRSADYRPLRDMLVLANVIGLAVFWLYPVAPPRMLPGFEDVVAASHTLGSWHTGPLASAANQLAAMPSLHIAWAAWCGVALWRLSRRVVVRALALLYPSLTALAVMATGNHYLLDILAGLATAALAALCAWAIQRRRRSGATGPVAYGVAHVTKLLRSR
jgi:membrane-associated phospholipid phosphatase